MQFLLPQEENKSAGLLRIAKKNIELLLTQKDEYEKFIQEQAESVVDRDVRQKGLIELQETLNLDDPPSIIECFDMSNTQGTDPVGSMVTFVEGRPSKGHYRRFKVRSKTTPDDVAMMRETMGRRYERALKERQTFPDLILVDGGKGQLNMAHQLLQDLGIDYIPHIGLAKREEEIFVYDQEQPIILEKDSLGLHILQAIRDEAHRFANTYHRLLRTKRQTQSILDDIPGIGPARKKKLLLYFGSTAEIRKATMEQVANLVGSTLATEIMQYLQTHPEETLAPKRRVKKTSKKAVLSHSSEDTELSPK
jgi:excinuclease ABC subunit C